MFTISPTSESVRAALLDKINNKTKPLGSLGLLEVLALQIGMIQNSVSPVIQAPEFVVFAADHGIADEGVSAFPKAVTMQMVLNFLDGGAAINCFCRQHGIALSVVDAGVAATLPDNTALINAKIAPGTNSFLTRPAMSHAQLTTAFEYTQQLIGSKADAGCTLIGFGEMGIANTASAAAIMAATLNIAADECVGRGTGLDDAGVAHKAQVIQQALDHHKIDPDDPMAILATFGGFEIAMITGGMLAAASHNMVVLVDGFIATAAALVACKINPLVREYLVFCHQSNEQAHQRLLDALNAKPILDIGMRLGEGSGAAVAYPLVVSAVNFLNEMASFNSAGVSNAE